MRENNINNLKIILFIVITTVVIAISAILYYMPNDEKVRQMVSQSFEDPNYLTTFMFSKGRNLVKNVSGNYMKISYKSLLGANHVLKFNAMTDTNLTFDYDLNIKNGKLKLFLITPDNEVREIANATKFEKVTLFLPNGKSSLVILGDDAEFSLGLNFYPHDKVSIATNNSSFIKTDRIYTDNED